MEKKIKKRKTRDERHTYLPGLLSSEHSLGSNDCSAEFLVATPSNQPSGMPLNADSCSSASQAKYQSVHESKSR